MSASSSFNELLFRDKLEKCLKKVQRLLQADKAQVLGPADQIPHKYNDKYLLAEQLVGCTAAAVWNTFQALGLNEEHYRHLREWRDEKKAISLRSSFESSCVFVKETTRDEESSHRLETEKTVAGVFREKTTTKVITKITEYHYLFRHHYRLTAFSGADPEAEKVLIVEQEGEQAVVVRNKEPPYTEKTFEAFDTNISWLLDVLPANATSLEFSINRSADDCNTPRRNKDVESALSCLQDLSQWSLQVVSQLTSRVFSVQNAFTEKSKIDLSALTDIEMLFNPVLPLFLDDEAETSEATGATVMEVGEGMIADDEAEAVLVPPAVPSASTSSAVTVSQQSTAQTSQAVLGQSEVCALVNEQSHSLRSRFTKLDALVTTASSSSSSSSSTPLITPILAHLVLSCVHLVDLSVQLQEGLDYIEFMLRRQLIAAIGRELGPADFANYMNFHYRKLFSEAYAPRAFNYGVRRSNEHSPEGIIRIESDFSDQVRGQPSNLLAVDGVRADSILTFCRQLPPVPRGGSSGSGGGNKLMEFALNASTRVRFRGERYVHCWLAHGFSPEARYRPTCGGGGGSDLQASLPKLQLIAQARQFSSYVVLLGRMASKQLFEPKHAFIVQNKDEWRLPLLLDPIPTPKQFRDAIESLSPEQQRFAQAFRAMQIESTLFAVCVVQIKPQLEKVLHLAQDSLTKEIRLTQDLMSLFIDYQIPPDLLSFDDLGKRKRPRSSSSSSSMGEEADDDSNENGGASPEARLEAVKRHVAAMLEMIAKAKEEEVKEANQQREFMFGSSQGPVYAAAPMTSRVELHTAIAARGASPSFALDSLLFSAPGNKTSASVPTAKMMAKTNVRGRGGGHAARSFQAPEMASVMAAQPRSNMFGMAPIQQQSILQAAPTTQVQPSPVKPSKEEDVSSSFEVVGGNSEIDVTKLPSLLEDQFSSLDSYNALRPTIINLGPSWSRKRQAALLAKPSANATPSPVEKVEQESAKQAAFDLLDALTRSGGLELEAVDLHIIVAATHGFDESLMETVIEKNINPIEQVERSALLMASTLHGVSGLDLLPAAGPHRARLLQQAGEVEEDEEGVEGKRNGGRRQEQKQQLRRLLEETSSEKTLPSDRLLLLNQQQQLQG